jgi:hypothetical protein
LIPRLIVAFYFLEVDIPRHPTYQYLHAFLQKMASVNAANTYDGLFNAMACFGIGESIIA